VLDIHTWSIQIIATRQFLSIIYFVLVLFVLSNN
jgi:hypothetical protein